MSGIHVIVDSTAQIPAEMLNRHANLHVVSLKVFIGNDAYLENEITAAKLCEIVRATGIYPKTSQPATGDFLELFDRFTSAGDEVVVITMSSQLSGTYQGALAAAQMSRPKQIHVVDSETTAMGMVMQAQYALNMAKAGKKASEIAAKLREMAAATRTLFVPDTLEYLHKGGRIGSAAKIFGSILQIKPVLYLVEGRVEVLDKVRTKQRAVNRMLEEVTKYKRLAYIGVGHIETPGEFDAITDRLKSCYPDVPLITGSLGAVLAAHLGPGVVGVVFQESIE